MIDANNRARPWILLFAAVCLVAINLRMTIAGVGPLLDEIAAEQGVTPAALGLLGSIPLFAWALVSPLAQSLASRIGLNAAVGWSLVLLTGATVWRSLPGSPINLWLGTGLIGVALAISNVLLPAVIKRDFGARVPLVMGVYSALLGVAAALGAAMVAPIAHAEVLPGQPLGWRWALLATGAAAPIALAVWVWVTGRTRATAPTAAAAPGPAKLGRRVWADPVAWLIACYMGAQSSNFYIYANWLAAIDTSRGTDPATAGLGVMVFHLCGMLGSLLAPLVARGGMRRVLPVLVPLLSVVGAIGVVFAPAALILWLALCGLSSGMGLSVALTYIAQRSTTPEVAGAVSGMVQSFGYLIAADLFPVLIGAVPL